MKKTLLLLILLLLLIATYFLVIKQDGGAKTPTFTDRELAVEDIEVVDKIFIRHRGRDGFFITRKGDRWYKDDTLLVRQSTMSNLNAVLSKMTIKYIPQGPEAAQIKQSFNQVGIEVKLFDGDNQMLRDYWVGRNTSKEDGTAFMVNGADQPYMMELPFTTGTLRSFFDIRDANVRDKKVMSIDTDRINEVSIDYPKNTESAFVVKRAGEQYDVTPFYKTTEEERRRVNPKAVENFLLEFQELYSETYESHNKHRESIEQSVPFMICTITMNDGDQETLKFFQVNKFLDQEPDPKVKRTLELVERFFMSTDSGDLFLIQHRLYKNIMVTYDFFYL